MIKIYRDFLTSILPKVIDCNFFYKKGFPVFSSDLEKLLVVLLVAFGTVCLLTNLLVLAILLKLRERGNLPFRYRLIISQALTGIITSTVLIFPLKVKISQYRFKAGFRTSANLCATTNTMAIVDIFPMLVVNYVLKISYGTSE